MTGKNTMWMGLGAGVLLYAAFHAASVKRTIKFFQYNISGIKFNLANLLKPEIIFSVEVFNPNRTSIPVTSFFGVIKHQDTILANFKNNVPVNIAGNETEYVAVSAKVNAITVLLSLIRGKKIKVLTVQGVMKTPMFDLPIANTIDLSTGKAISGIGNNLHISRPHMFSKCKKRFENIKPSGFLNYGNHHSHHIAGTLV